MFEMLNNLSVIILEVICSRIFLALFSWTTLTWWRVPYFTDIEHQSSFMKCVDEMGFDVAVNNYSDFIHYFAIISENNDIPIEAIICMANELIENKEGSAYYEYDSYMDEQYIKAEKISIPVVASENETSFLPYIENYQLDNKATFVKTYMHGVLVEDEIITLPLAIKGTFFEKLYVNIKSNSYHLNVARNRLLDDSSRKLGTVISKEVYSDLLNELSGKITDEEKDLIRKYITML